MGVLVNKDGHELDHSDNIEEQTLRQTIFFSMSNSHRGLGGWSTDVGNAGGARVGAASCQVKL